MLSLRSFHLFLITLSIVVTSGFGMWAVLNADPVMGTTSFAVSIALVVYGAYFAAKARRAHLE